MPISQTENSAVIVYVDPPRQSKPKPSAPRRPTVSVSQPVHCEIVTADPGSPCTAIDAIVT